MCLEHLAVKALDRGPLVRTEWSTVRARQKFMVYVGLRLPGDSGVEYAPEM